MAKPGDAFAQVNVLLAEDEAFMRQLVVRVLRDIGIANVTTTADGEEALLRMRSQGDRFHVLIADLQMPKLNGLALIKAVRALPSEQNPGIPVLVLTGHGEEKVVKTALGLGINGFLVKPVSRQALETRLAKILSEQQAGEK